MRKRFLRQEILEKCFVSSEVPHDRLWLSNAPLREDFLKLGF